MERNRVYSVCAVRSEKEKATAANDAMDDRHGVELDDEKCDAVWLVFLLCNELALTNAEGKRKGRTED